MLVELETFHCFTERERERTCPALTPTIKSTIRNLEFVTDLGQNENTAKRRRREKRRK